MLLGEVQERRSNAIDDARLAYATALSPAADKPEAASPTRNWLRARALLGQARLALPADPTQALRLAREAQAQITPPAVALREIAVIAQAKSVEARARAASGP